MMVMMMMVVMMIFQGSCWWAWPPRMLPYVVLEFYTFTTDGIAPAGNTLVASICSLLRHAGEHSSSILLSPKPQGRRPLHSHKCRRCLHDDHYLHISTIDASRATIELTLVQSTTLGQLLCSQLVVDASGATTVLTLVQSTSQGRPLYSH